MPVILQTSLLLVLSNVCVVRAPQGHEREAVVHRGAGELGRRSGGVSPAGACEPDRLHRALSYTALSLGQLKILQEVIALTVFVPFAVLYMKQPLKLNYLWAALCICAAVYFVFRES